MPINATAELTDKEGLTQSVVSYKFKMLEPTEMNFLPGQHIMVNVGHDQNRNYSIATSPLKNNKEFEIVVDLSPQGLGSRYLDGLDIGSKISFVGEVGEFTIPDELNANLFFIAQETGISPLKSMIDSIIANREDFDVDIFVYTGFKTQNDILFKDLFSSYLTDKHIDDYKIFVNQDFEDTPPYIKSGQVHHFVELVPQEKLADGHFFLCGNDEMITLTEQALKSKGVAPECILKEKFY